MSQATTFFPLSGGTDLITPALSVPAGRVRASVNYEPDPRGYRRIDGYERYDGHAKPSDATYSVITFTAGAHAVVAGDEVIGATSGAKGIVMVVTVTSGAWGSGTAAGTLVVRPTTGTFSDGETIQIQSVAAFSPGFSTGFQ